MLDKILKNDLAAIHFTNAVHNKKMGLISQEDLNCFSSEFSINAEKEVPQFDRANAAQVYDVFQKTVRNFSFSPKLVTADLLGTQFDEMSTVVTYRKFRSFLEKPENEIMSKELKGNTEYLSPNLTIEQKLEIISESIVSGTELRLPFFRGGCWIAPNEQVTPHSSAKEMRDLLGLDHLPIDENEESDCFLIKLDIAIDQIEAKCTMHRPTIFDGPSARHRAFTNHERQTSNKLFHGMTVNLEGYDDGSPEVVMKINDDESFVTIKRLTPLGSLTSKHEKVDDHEDFKNLLNQQTTNSGYDLLNNCDALDCYFEQMGV